MPRQPRTVIAQCTHHVTQRGNNRQDVFFVEADRRAYLAYLREAAIRFSLRVHAYCLMTNHIHLVVEPLEEPSLANVLKRTSQLYAQYVNRMHGRTGHFWQDRFFSCPLDDMHLWRTLAYVERNPVRAHLCSKAWEWRWSNAAAHCGADDPRDDPRAQSRPQQTIHPVLRTETNHENSAPGICQLRRAGCAHQCPTRREDASVCTAHTTGPLQNRQSSPHIRILFASIALLILDAICILSISILDGVCPPYASTIKNEGTQ